MSQNSGAPADFEAIEEFCGFNEVALDAFQLATKQQLGVEVSTWIIIAACTMWKLPFTALPLEACFVGDVFASERPVLGLFFCLRFFVYDDTPHAAGPLHTQKVVMA